MLRSPRWSAMPTIRSRNPGITDHKIAQLPDNRDELKKQVLQVRTKINDGKKELLDGLLLFLVIGINCLEHDTMLYDAVNFGKSGVTYPVDVSPVASIVCLRDLGSR